MRHRKKQTAFKCHADNTNGNCDDNSQIILQCILSYDLVYVSVISLIIVCVIVCGDLETYLLLGVTAVVSHFLCHLLASALTGVNSGSLKVHRRIGKHENPKITTVVVITFALIMRQGRCVTESRAP